MLVTAIGRMYAIWFDRHNCFPLFMDTFPVNTRQLKLSSNDGFPRLASIQFSSSFWSPSSWQHLRNGIRLFETRNASFYLLLRLVLPHQQATSTAAVTRSECGGKPAQALSLQLPSYIHGTNLSSLYDSKTLNPNTVVSFVWKKAIRITLV